MKKKSIKAWAVIHELKGDILEVGFIDCDESFKPTLDMFVDQTGVPPWAPNMYKVVPCTITY